MRVVLPSNASLQNFPRNSLSSYTVQLPQSLDFSNGQWEVGLEEIQFYKSWFNVIDCSITFSVNYKETIVKIPNGYYESEQLLIDAINNSISLSEVKGFTFEYRQANKSCYFKYEDSPVSIDVKLSPSLKEIINEQENKITFKREGTIIYGYYNTTMRLHTIFNLMVYTDIAEASIIGNINSRLLRAVHIENGHWRVQCTSYQKLQYFKVNRTNIRTITIHIYTDYGDKVPFTHGRTIVTLDFRKVKAINLI